MTRSRAAAIVAGLALLAVYAATAAPDVTFWDAGEFVAAFATFGVPHPPGTPLFVALGRAWALALGVAGFGTAAAAGLLSAACTAAAGGVTAALLARWTGSAAAGVAGALCAGGTTTAWANATEPEVYAPALLLALLALSAADAAGRGGARDEPARGGARATVAAAYALALAAPLHLAALVAAPAAAWLAAACPRGSGRSRRAGAPRVRWARLATLAGTAVATAGAGTGRLALAVAGLTVPLGVALARRRPGGAPAGGEPGARGEALGAAAVTALAAGALVVLLARARHDPWLNQGDPSTWAALADVVGRRQYAPAAPWPRQAPWWLQLANLGEWADWQVALGLGPGAAPGWRRTPVTLAYAALGALGALWHRRRDRRSFRAWALLLACGSVGVAAYLNLKAGPSFGAGVLGDAAPHEARERDYFFVLAWWAWGAWAGLGAVLVARRVAAVVRPAAAAGAARVRRRPRAASAVGVAAAALPVALNWPVASRRREPEASTAGALARALLLAAPPRAVLLVRADNDTYPLWAVQAAERLRPDVTPVTLSLLPAAWYRRELARRHGLLAPAETGAWLGADAAVRAIAARAAERRRPLATALAVEPTVRAALGGRWAHHGLLVARTAESEAGRAGLAALPEAVAARFGVGAVDTVAVRTAGALVERLAPGLFDVPARAGGDGVGAWARRQLACPAALTVTLAPSPARSRAAAAAARVEGACEAR